MNTSTHKNAQDEDFSDWITQAEAARVRAVSQERIRKLIQNGRLQSIEIGGRKFVRRSEVEAFAPLTGGRPPKKKTTPKKASSKKKAAPKQKTD